MKMGSMRAESVFVTVMWVALGALVGISQTHISGQEPVKVMHVNATADNSACFLRALTSQYYVCQTLEDVDESVQQFAGQVEIVLQSDEPVRLTSMITFRNLLSIKLTAASRYTGSTLHCYSSNASAPAGLALLNIQSITIENLTISHCGSFQEYTKFGLSHKDIVHFSFRAAVHVQNATNISVADAIFKNNSGAGLVILDSNGGIVNISRCIFDHNMIPKGGSQQYAGGGGVLVIAQNNTDAPTAFLFRDCQFLNNIQTAEGNSTFLTAFGHTFPGSGQGGGLSIRLKGDVTNNYFTILNCTFNRNSAFSGAGLAVTMRWKSHNNSVLIQNSTFEENGCQEDQRSGSGGGALFGYRYKFDRNQIQGNGNKIRITNVVFRNNCAVGGGGTAFYSSYGASNTITFFNCSWIGNKARVGAAVDISPQIADRLSGGLKPPIKFEDCEFINNQVSFETQDANEASGVGTFYSSLMDIKFRSFVKFVNNSGSAFIIVNGVADFCSCSAEFANNTGVQGGAIALIGTSSIKIGQNYDCTLNFTNNKASDSGGAIYSSLVDEHDLTMSKNCFIRYFSHYSKPSNWNTSLIFKGNSAKNYGHSIYSTSLLPCRAKCSKDNPIPTFITSCEKFIIDLDKETENQIATDVAKFVIKETLPLHVIPGEERFLKVTLEDDMNQTVYTSLRASIESKNSDTLKLHDSFLCLSGNSIRLQGKSGASGELLLQTVSSRKHSIRMNVTLDQCPPGFSINEKYECKCDAKSYVGLTLCDNDRFHAYLAQGFWVGYLRNRSQTDGGVLGTTPCPLGFCKYNQSRATHLPQNAADLDKVLCAPNRTGTICGNCTSGLVVYYNSPSYRCREARLCKFGWLFYFLSELVPVTILFVIVLAFNISFTSGGINSFILFSQLLDTLVLDGSGAIEIPSTIRNVSFGYHVFYGLFSLNFFNIEPLSFCLWNGATVMDVLVFKYVTIAYSLILIFSVIVFMRHCAPKLLGKHFKISVLKNSVIHGLSAFIVVCYAQCVKVSLRILYQKVIQGKKGQYIYPSRVWLSGEMEYLSRDHTPYALVAIFFLTTVGILPPLLLIVYPLINKITAFCRVDESCLVMSISKRIPMSKLKPFLDSFQGCFKDDYRFFAGLYFLYRWIGLVVYATAVSTGAFYGILEAILIVILLTHATVQPYESRWHNIMDILFLSNVALINGFTAFMYCYSTISADEVRDTKIVNMNAWAQLVLIYLPILLYLASCVWIVCSKLYLAWSRKYRRGQECVPLEDFPARLLDISEDEESSERMQVGYDLMDRDSY